MNEPDASMWSPRQVSAWRGAWRERLFDWVECHGASPDGGGLYTVPSSSHPGQYHAVWRYPLAPDGYLYVCDCEASERGGVVCRHIFAVYLWRLVYRLNWRINAPVAERRRDAAENH